MDWTALVGGQRIAAGLQPFAGRVSRLVPELGKNGADLGFRRGWRGMRGNAAAVWRGKMGTVRLWYIIAR